MAVCVGDGCTGIVVPVIREMAFRVECRPKNGRLCRGCTGIVVPVILESTAAGTVDTGTSTGMCTYGRFLDSAADLLPTFKNLRCGVVPKDTSSCYSCPCPAQQKNYDEESHQSI
jgi:hypothetical protein